MSFNKEKFKALVHYICRTCSDPERLGKTKLHRILWLSDVQNYQLYTQTITGERYIKMQFGPCASHIDSVLEELKSEGLLHIIPPDEEYKPTLYYAKGEPNKGIFSEKELKIIDSQIRLVVGDHTATSISDRSHDEIWGMAMLREEIPLQAYLVRRFATPTPEDFAWAKSEISKIAKA